MFLRQTINGTSVKNIRIKIHSFSEQLQIIISCHSLINLKGVDMRVFTICLSLLFVIIFSLGAFADDDEKKVKEKRVWIQKTEHKAGLGVLVSNIDDDPDSDKSGAKIVEVFKGSEAEKIGLKKGDIIAEVNGKSINKPSDLVDIFDDVEEGTERMREVKHRFHLSSKASGKYKNQRVKLLLEEPVEGSSKWKTYKEYTYTLNISFTNDFDDM